MVSRERRGLLVGVLTSGLVLTLFDAFVIKAAGELEAWPFWLPVLVPAAAVLWLVVADWPRATHRFIPLVLAVDAFSVVATAAEVTAGDSSVWVFTESAAQMSLVFAIARWLPARTAVWLGTVTGIAASALPMRFAAPAGVWGALAMCLIWSLGAVAGGVLGAYLRQQESKRQRDIADVRRTQRLDLARDLHDFVAHHVSGIVVQAQASQFVAQQDPQQAVEALRRIEDAGQRALDSMRRTVGMLRADEPGDQAPATPTAGIADLPELVDRFTASGDVTVHLDVGDGVDDSLPPEVTTSAYRVVLEALTNVRRHAVGATDVHVTVHKDPRGAALLVRVNDGVPQHAHPDRGRGGFGLLGLSERVTAVGGTFTAGPRKELGWTVEASLPLPVKASRA